MDVGPDGAFDAMVLAAGLGTRLLPLTRELPKPLLPVGDCPLLVTILAKLHQKGASRLAVNTHYMSEEILANFNSLSFTVHVSHEEKICGTAGGVARARRYLSGAPLLVANGDIYGELPVGQLLHLGQTDPAWAVTRVPPGRPSTVGVDRNGHIVRLRGERFGVEAWAADFRGCVLLPAARLASLPEQGCLVQDFALPHLRASGRISVVEVASPFFDIGTLPGYLAASLAWLDSRDSGREENEGSWLDASARWDAGVRFSRSLVGPGAVLAGAGLVEQSVVLPGARARAPLSRAIVTPAGRVLTVDR